MVVVSALGTPEGGNSSLDELRGAYINLARVDEPADFVLGEKREEKVWVSSYTTLLG